jgi:hypothetical protein
MWISMLCLVSWLMSNLTELICSREISGNLRNMARIKPAWYPYRYITRRVLLPKSEQSTYKNSIQECAHRYEDKSLTSPIEIDPSWLTSM